MANNTDWQAMRADYEQGMSLRALAAKYGISKTYIIEKRDREQWNRPPTTDRPTTVPMRLPSSYTPPPAPAGAIAIARAGLRLLGNNVNVQSLTLTEHKLLADSLSQYVKVLVTAPAEDESDQGIYVDFAKLPTWKRVEMRRLLAAPDPQEGAS